MSFEPRSTIVINQSVAVSNPFTINLGNLGIRFPAKKMVIRQLLYCNIAGTDNGIYTLYSSLTGSNIASVYVGVQGTSQNPQSEFPISTFTPMIEFRLSPTASAFPTPSGMLSMTLEFV